MGVHVCEREDYYSWTRYHVSIFFYVYYLKMLRLSYKHYNYLLLHVNGCEIWSAILIEQCTLSVFDNGVLRMIFGHK
jgi:hypothetical protein